LKRHLSSVAVLAVLAGVVLVGLGCEPPPKHDLALTAPALVTKAGLPDIGRLVTFTADKYTGDGAIESDARMTSDKFTDFLGYADFLFGYSLEYDEESNYYTGHARVIGSVEYNGTEYADTAYMPVRAIPSSTQAYVLDTLRIDLPAKQ
jgi:hypothetical protein